MQAKSGQVNFSLAEIIVHWRDVQSRPQMNCDPDMLEPVNVLFVCSRNRLRSPTAEVVFSDPPEIETASAGTSPDAETVVSADLVEWADIVFAMETVHKRRLNERFSSLLKTRKLVVLGIPDNYEYMDEGLIAVLRQKVTPHLKSHPKA
jgi:predicted protein tyrosine phosphatase